MNDSVRPTLSPSLLASRSRGAVGRPSSPALVLMLYEVALRHIGDAALSLERGGYEHARDRIGRAIAVIDELTLTLDAQDAPELSEALLGTYRFCRRRLLEANQWRDVQALADVTSALRPLHDVWSNVAAA